MRRGRLRWGRAAGRWLQDGWWSYVAALSTVAAWLHAALVPARWRAQPCPHPDHRIRHIHGDERNYGYVAECMECYRRFRDWPGGHHGATRCYVAHF